MKTLTVQRGDPRGGHRPPQNYSDRFEFSTAAANAVDEVTDPPGSDFDASGYVKVMDRWFELAGHTPQPAPPAGITAEAVRNMEKVDA